MKRTAQSKTLAMFCIFAALNPKPALSGNFAGPDPQILEAAEPARVRSAMFWSGTQLPGDWSAPCTIEVQAANHAGGGKTCFHFAQGEVFGWRMSICGRHDALLRDVIPHEVDHMVRASLNRHPTERWLDEGCASLFESPTAHLRLRQAASRISAERVTLNWLEQKIYPASQPGLDELYAVGFSLVEFLISRETPLQLLEFQRDPGPISQRLQRYYGLSSESLLVEWRRWKTDRDCDGLDCSQCRCRIHQPLPVGVGETGNSPGRQRLTVWTAGWCLPCRQFHADYEGDELFRSELKAHFDLEFRDADAQATAARACGVNELPAFCGPQGQVTGYQGKADLLKRLGIELPAVAVPAEPPSQATPANPSERVQEISAAPLLLAPAPESLDPQASIGNHSASGPADAPRDPTSSRSSITRIGKSLSEMARLVPVTLSVLQWAGVIGGSFATGGLGGIAMAAAWSVFKLRAAAKSRRTRSVSSAPERSAGDPRVPFPRRLDETGELLELGKTEGRVAVLDTLRGMFLDDELEKLSASKDAAEVQWAARLRNAIDARVDEVAPLSTT